jgi:hypothetical protein
MRNLRFVLPALLALAACSTATASAGPVPWGGSGSNSVGPAYALLTVANGKAKVSNVQMIITCADDRDGTFRDVAFSAQYRTAVALRRNHYAFDFTATSGDLVGRVRLDGVLGSTGRGTIRIRIEATSSSDAGAVIEHCAGETHFALRRGGH